LSQLGRASEALRWLDQAAALDGRYATTHPLARYDLACDLALGVPLLGQVEGGIAGAEAQARERENEAMTTLQRAIDQGYTFPAIIANDHDLIPLHARRDFQLLLRNLTFPPDVFAR
jgi:hypothetical protein